ncbi:hypothetical protein PCANC_27541 [Puccinia coronata f. sp. avenae]|uniref:Uncharacterized protein n=1 Tax=Puccinia coronata f. sp. avenae TaxID=200324 RepID=A0A2N5SAJ4_9BASI|nr:hypothetical protein PCANC_27541 [Puccinia coronata f. sp. avenae]
MNCSGSLGPSSTWASSPIELGWSKDYLGGKIQPLLGLGHPINLGFVQLARFKSDQVQQGIPAFLQKNRSNRKIQRVGLHNEFLQGIWQQQNRGTRQSILEALERHLM